MEIKTARYIVSSPRENLCPPPDRAEFAFIGRSNVGKSSLINMLTGRNRLAKISGSPGKTQLINHFLVEYSGTLSPFPSSFYLVDLPGYGYAKVSQKTRKEWATMIQQYLTKRMNLMTIFVLIDSRHKPQQIDLDFLKKLGEWQVPFNIIFTKTDKLPQREAHKNMRTFIEKMKEDWEFIPATFPTSSEKSTGRKAVLAFIEELCMEFSPGGE